MCIHLHSHFVLLPETKEFKMTKKNEDPALSEKEQEIVAVGASIASGCLPCTKFHLRVAASVGVTEAEIRQAVADAVRVREEATERMAGAGGLPQGGEARSLSDPAGPCQLVRELVATAAAYAVNCAAGLQAHMTAARGLGATDRQMFAAIKIACAVRDVACQKTKIAAGLMLGVSEEQALACDCSEDESPSAGDRAGCAPDKAMGATGGSCGCRPGAKTVPTNSNQKKGE
jgi:AhpD family alkylhydroperoxidase